MKLKKHQKINVKTKYGVFDVILKTYENENGYVVLVPALPEIVTQGDSLKEAQFMAKDAIELAMEYKIDEYIASIKSQETSKIASPLRV